MAALVFHGHHHPLLGPLHPRREEDRIEQHAEEVLRFVSPLDVHGGAQQMEDPGRPPGIGDGEGGRPGTPDLPEGGEEGVVEVARRALLNPPPLIEHGAEGGPQVVGPADEVGEADEPAMAAAQKKVSKLTVQYINCAALSGVALSYLIAKITGLCALGFLAATPVGWVLIGSSVIFFILAMVCLHKRHLACQEAGLESNTLRFALATPIAIAASIASCGLSHVAHGIQYVYLLLTCAMGLFTLISSVAAR